MSSRTGRLSQQISLHSSSRWQSHTSSATLHSSPSSPATMLDAARPNTSLLKFASSCIKLLLYFVVLFPMLLICAFVATGPSFHWSAAVVAAFLVGIANFAIYDATIYNMVAAYGPYSVSAKERHDFTRNFLAGGCALYTGPLYQKFRVRNPYLVLFGLAVLFCVLVYAFYFKGPQIRAKSNFDGELPSKYEAGVVTRLSYMKCRR